MTHPNDPRELLSHKDVSTRATAVRAIGLQGNWDDLALMITKATDDKSPSVRLNAAASAVEIASRYRGAAGQQSMTRGQKTQIFDALKRLDPAKNPGLLLLLSAVADQKALDRLGRMLRDPHVGVRQAATIAVRRLVLSAAAQGDERAENAVRTWLESNKLPPDAVLELARIVGEAGFSDMGSALQYASVAGRPHAGVVEEAHERLTARTDDSQWNGLWISDGLDVFQLGDGSALEWFFWADGTVWHHKQSPETVSHEGLAACAGGTALRMLWAPKVGEAGSFRVLQADGYTFWRCQGKALVGFVDDHLDELSGLGKGAALLSELLQDVDGALAQRAQVLCLWKGGSLDAAWERIETLPGHKRPRADLFWFKALIAKDRGDTAAIKPALASFLERSAQKAVFRTQAEEMLAGIK
ncbi:MAG: hypothetical protein GWP91_16450 [Rhodobacterales bacterium]|nr:hypothetical protein [Rhodobacterales bacterium]